MFFVEEYKDNKVKIHDTLDGTSEWWNICDVPVSSYDNKFYNLELNKYIYILGFSDEKFCISKDTCVIVVSGVYFIYDTNVYQDYIGVGLKI